jgi:hypothetical protein
MRFQLLVDERRDGPSDQVGIRRAGVELVEKESKDACARQSGRVRRSLIGFTGQRYGRSRSAKFSAGNNPSGAVFANLEVLCPKIWHGVSRSIDYHHVQSER